MNEKSRKEVKPEPLTVAEVREAFEPLNQKYGPLLKLEEAAELIGYEVSTMKRKLSEGCFAGSAKRGKPVLFWRDRLIVEVMNTPFTSPRRRNTIKKADCKQTMGVTNEAH